MFFCRPFWSIRPNYNTLSLFGDCNWFDGHGFQNVNFLVNSMLFKNSFLRLLKHFNLISVFLKGEVGSNKLPVLSYQIGQPTDIWVKLVIFFFWPPFPGGSSELDRLDLLLFWRLVALGDGTLDLVDLKVQLWAVILKAVSCFPSGLTYWISFPLDKVVWLIVTHIGSENIFEFVQHLNWGVFLHLPFRNFWHELNSINEI